MSDDLTHSVYYGYSAIWLGRLQWVLLELAGVPKVKFSKNDSGRHDNLISSNETVLEVIGNPCSRHTFLISTVIMSMCYKYLLKFTVTKIVGSKWISESCIL